MENQCKESYSSSVRFSNASTADLIDLSDEEDVSSKSSKHTSTIPDIILTSLVPITQEIIDQYRCLNIGLNNLYSTLSEEMQPVNIRELKSVPANSIKLATISRSNLLRRRVTMPSSLNT